MFLVAGVKAQVQICPGFLHSELGLARAHPWQCGVLRFAAGVPWEHRGHVGDEIHLRGVPGDGVISSGTWETLGKHGKASVQHMQTPCQGQIGLHLAKRGGSAARTF